MELARCLTTFPNAHTLKLHHPQLTVALEQAITQWFGGDNRFPQIRSLIIPEDCYSLLKYCPGVRYVHTIGQGSETALTKYGASILVDYCPLIENMCLAIPATVESLPVLLFR